MRTSFSCETYGGEKYEDVAFRVNIKGVMETAVPVPDYILKCAGARLYFETDY